MRRKQAGFVIAQAAIFVAVIALVSLPLQFSNNTQVSTSSTVSEGPLVFASGVASDGLQLKMVLNATSMRSDGAITGYVTVLNTSDQNVTVSALTQSLNLTSWIGDISMCETTGFTGGYAVFQGRFTAGNISSSGNPLRLWPTLPASCSGGGGYGTATFLPDGGQGVGRAIFATAPHAVMQDRLNTTSYICKAAESSKDVCAYGLPGLVGYWNYTSNWDGSYASSSVPFVRFSPGEYTIVTWDDWNQYVYATFVVEPSPQTTTLTSGASPDGLQLELTLNATTMPSDGAITGQVGVVNTSNQNVTVSTLGRTQNVTAWSSYINECPSDYFMGYVVFPGRVTSGNVSSAGTPLELVPPPSGILCPPPENLGELTFLPGKVQTLANEFPGPPPFVIPDWLNVTTIFPYTQDSQFSIDCGCAMPGLVGYWNWDISGSVDLPPQTGFMPFPPGEYTVVAWDDWNQYVYVTFVVQPVDGSQSSPALAASCFVSIPAGAQLGLFANSTFNGNNVTYANGTSVLFSNYSCPRPAFGGSNQGADVYAMAVAAVRNSSFVAAENGSEFLFQEGSGLSCSTIGTQQCSMTLFFYHYGENGSLFRCGGGLNANLASMLYRRDALAGITVTFYTLGHAGPDGVSNNTAWDLQDPAIQAMPAAQVMQYYDSSYPCG